MVIMSQNDATNPFQQSRLSILSTTSLLSYGDDSFSLFKTLNSKSTLNRSQVRRSQRQIQKQIMGKYQRQMYSMDEGGHCLAELIFDQKITQQSQKTKEDFWDRTKTFLSQIKIENPFGTGLMNSSFSYSTNNSYSTRFSNSGRQTNMKKISDRQTMRKQMIKMREVITTKKEKYKVQIQPGLSLSQMYKAKRKQQKLNTLIQIEKANQQKYTESIIVQGQKYYFVQFS